MPRTTKKTIAPIEKHTIPTVPAAEQPYKVPENWRWVRLCNVAQWGSGGTPSRKNPDYYSGDIPWVKTGELNDDYILSTEEKITKEAVKRSSAKLFPINTIIIAMYGATIGKTAILGIEATTNQACACGVCNPNGLYYKYLFYYARSKKTWFIELGKGGAQPNISQDIIKKTPIPLPPLAEQQRIVDRIESLFAKLDEAREKAQAVVDGFENRKAAILHKAFTGELTRKWREERGIGMESWKNVVIDDIAEVKGGKRVPKGMELVYEDTGHSYIKAGNLKQGTVLDDGIMFVPPNVLEFIKNYTVKSGDVYITNVGACIGDCGVIPNKYNGANLTENAVKLTNLKCDSYFLAHYLSSGKIQSKIKAMIASATLGKLSIMNIKQIDINLPLLCEQQIIISIINNLISKERRARDLAESVITQIDGMKKAILARAFRSELGTNDPSEAACEG